jgi:hypothetical protein
MGPRKPGARPDDSSGVTRYFIVGERRIALR